jgi:predicted nucleic acid-binding protein
LIELADTSAWTARQRAPAVQAHFDQRVARGQIATCRPVVLELLARAASAVELERRRQSLDVLRDLPVRRREWDRAADVMHELAGVGGGRHRLPFADLLVAAAAEVAELPVLHYDRHFELIAEVTGQPVRALAPLGSL